MTEVTQQQQQQHFKTMTALIFGQFVRHPLTKLFHLSNLLQMPNDHRMVNVELFNSFSCSCKRIGFLMIALSWLLSTSNGQPLFSSSSRLSTPLQNFLNHHCTFVSSSWAKCVVDVANCLLCFMTYFELLKFVFCLTSFP